MNKGLLLTRRTGESCVCFSGDQTIKIVVEEISGSRVRLRFIADDSVDIYRSEILGEKK